MASPHPTRIVRFQLLGALLGVSIPFAVQSLIERYSIPVLIATIAFFLTSLNFFHGKVVTLEDEDYNNALTDRPVLALSDYILNLLVILGFVFMAFCLEKPGRLIIVNITIRIIDIILVLITMSVCSQAAVRKAQKSWLILNCIIVISFILCAIVFFPAQYAVSITFLVLVIVDISLDYYLNHELYFSMANDWEDMAQFWDAMQGEYGDIFRRAVIIPAIQRELIPIEGKRILDVGCGNGCIARALSRVGAKVIATDKSKKLLEIAESYEAAGITYRYVDLDTHFDNHGALIEGGGFDAVVACFTLQDCQGIRLHLALLRRTSGRKDFLLSYVIMIILLRTTKNILLHGDGLVRKNITERADDN